MGCTYRFKDSDKKLGYYDMVELLKKDTKGMLDLLFSKGNDIQTRNINAIDNIIKTNANQKIGASIFKGIRDVGSEKSQTFVDFMEGAMIAEADDDISTTGPKTMSVQHFISTNEFNSDMEEPMSLAYDENKYLTKERERYLNANIDELTADRMVKNLLKSIHRIAKDSKDLHKILTQYSHGRKYSAIESVSKGTSYVGLEHLISDKSGIGDLVLAQVNYKNARFSKIAGDPSTIDKRFNIVISAKTNGGDTLKAHIDHIAFHPDGSVEVFNIKCSYQPYSEWDRAKIETYKQEAALIARILEYNGVSAKNIKYNIIPVQLHYNDAFDKITDISVDDAKCITHSGDAFILHELFKHAAKFVKSNVEKLNIDLSRVNKVDSLLKLLFPNDGIMAQGVQASIVDFIERNWRVWSANSPKSQSGWTLKIGDEIVVLTDEGIASKNQELVRKISSDPEKYMKQNFGYETIDNVISSVKLSRRAGKSRFADPHLESVFSKYLKKKSVNEDDGTFELEWDLIENPLLEECNILLFKNSAGQIDVVVASKTKIDLSFKMGHHDNILGTYVPDTRAITEDGTELLKANYGNLEMIRAMYILNEVIQDLLDTDTLGDIRVIGDIGNHATSINYPIALIFPHFFKAIQVSNEINPDNQIENNFTNIEFTDPVELLINDFYQILDDSPNVKDSKFEAFKQILSGSESDGKLHFASGESIDSLASAEEDEVRIERVSEFINKISLFLRSQDGGFERTNAENIARLVRLYDTENETSHSARTVAAKLLSIAQDVLSRLEGNVVIRSSEYGDMDGNFSRPLNMQEAHIRIVSKLAFDAIHFTQGALSELFPRIEKIFNDFYEAKGYGKAQNTILGNQSTVFEHLFRSDIDNDLIFKNPYDPSENLDDSDRKFLKQILFEFALFKTLNDFNIKSYNEEKVKEYANNHIEYLFLPLERASESTQWSHPSVALENLKTRVGQYFRDPKRLFEELYENITEDEKLLLNLDLQNMLAYNPFRRSATQRGRNNLIGVGNDAKPKSYWETNVLNVFIDFVAKEIRARQMNKALIRSRGIQLGLRLSAVDEGNPEKYAKHIKRIDDYITTSIFGMNNMTEDGKKFAATVAPLRRGLSWFNIGANVVGGIRDVIGGFRSNMVRTLIKYLTDCNMTDVLWAYGKVFGNGINSPMSVDLLDRLNTKYLISNINRENQQSGYKTNTGGITNPSNLVYSTLSKPDYLNRMTLFLSKLHHDESFDAYEIGSDGELKYNWTKDKRFDLLASDNKTNMAKYNKQLSLYLSLLEAFNKENPELHLVVSKDTPLPDGYTMSLVESIKTLSDTIYGAYDKSTKAGFEFHAVGSLLGVFGTWLNGIYDAYFGKRRPSSFETEKRLRTRNGQPLFFTPDTYEITTEDTGIPVVEDVPIIVLGIAKTLLDCYNELAHTGDFKKNILLDPMQMRNLRRLLSDIITWFLMYVIISQIVKPMYDKHKKEADGRDLALNLIIEALYKGYIASGEEMKGPYPILDYVTNNTGAASIKWGTNMAAQINGFVFGDKTLLDTAASTTAFFRGARDSMKMYKRDITNGLTLE